VAWGIAMRWMRITSRRRNAISRRTAADARSPNSSSSIASMRSGMNCSRNGSYSSMTLSSVRRSSAHGVGIAGGSRSTAAAPWR
jgi:hypothetical protein